MKLHLPLGVASLASLLGLAGCVVADGPPAPVTYVDAPPPPPPPTEYAQPSETVYTPPQGTYVSAPNYSADDYDSGDAPVPDEGEVQVQTVQDFDEPLQPYGDWVVVGSYGRCWRPSHVDHDWRPYCDGHWVDSDRGWCWQTDEPWGWATYHYGRWDNQPGYGWVWIPHTRWAPAWVEWRSGGGYVGWAPLPPGARFGGQHQIRNYNAPDRSFVFVQERHFNDHVRPTTVVNNTTIIHQTTNITNINIVNNRVRNEGPRVEVIEKASGQQLHPVQAVQLRRQIEQPVAVRHPMLTHPHANPPVGNSNGGRVDSHANNNNQHAGPGPLDTAVHAGPGAPRQPQQTQPHPAETGPATSHPTQTYHNELTPHPTTLPLHHDNTAGQLRPTPTMKPLPTHAAPVVIHPTQPPHTNTGEPHSQAIRANPVLTPPPRVEHPVNQPPVQHHETVTQQPRPALPAQNPVVIQHPQGQGVPAHGNATVPANAVGPNGRGPATNPPAKAPAVVVHPKVVPPPQPVHPKENSDQTPPQQQQKNQGN